MLIKEWLESNTPGFIDEKVIHLYCKRGLYRLVYKVIIILFIITDAFVDGVKGEQLAPFVVDPPQSMTFAEHEVKTILSFLDGYQKLGNPIFKSLHLSSTFRKMCIIHFFLNHCFQILSEPKVLIYIYSLLCWNCEIGLISF